MFGDLNLGFIQWNVDDSAIHRGLTQSNYGSSLGYAFVDFLSSNDLHQHNNLSNCDNRFLDVVISNLQNVNVTAPLDQLSKCYPIHPCLMLNIPDSNTEYLKPEQSMVFKLS
ncbi:hypothetical protein ACJJTC_017316 [Scirpophaga incertulas]